jgi:hypothetical protein
MLVMVVIKKTDTDRIKPKAEPDKLINNLFTVIFKSMQFSHII